MAFAKPELGSANWRVVCALAGALLLDNAARHVIFGMFPVLRAQLSFSNTQLGLTSSLFLWIYAIVNPYAGRLADRFPRKKLVLGSLVLWSLITILTGLSGSAGMILVTRALLGVAEAFFMPAAMALIAANSQPQVRSVAVSLFFLGEYAGNSIGVTLGSYAAQEWGWRVPFFLFGVAGLLYAIPMRLGIPSQPSAAIPAATTRQQGIKALIKIPTFRLVATAFAICVSTVWMMYTWLPTFLYERFSLDMAHAGRTSSLYLQGANVTGSLVAGLLADRLYLRTRAARLWVSSAGFLLAAPCLYLLGQSSSLNAAKIAIVALGVSLSFFVTNLTASLFDFVPRSSWAFSMASLNFVGSAVAGAASLMEGGLKSALGLDSILTILAMLCLGSCCVLALAARVTFPKDRRSASAELPLPVATPT
jgi:MFS transporter, Spinster family, sphingosine-1-phosphate transporter